MKKVFFIFLLSCHALVYSAPLLLYYCKKYSDAESCGGSCINRPSINDKFDANRAQKLDFMVNRNNATVLIKTYFGSEFNSSQVLDGCKIFDKNNWDCSKEPEWIANANWFLYDVYKMNDGIYSHGTFTSRGESHGLTAFCAK